MATKIILCVGQKRSKQHLQVSLWTKSTHAFKQDRV